MVLQVSQLRLDIKTARGNALALNDVSFSLGKGETLGLIGESGCGKSLTALSIMGLQPENARLSGSIRLLGQELVGLPDPALARLRGARMAMIFQEPMTALNPLHTIADQIAESIRLHEAADRASARARALQLLERVQLPRARERLDAYPHQLSGGQRQRVMIAMALACGPDLLIADEPTTALDVTLAQEVLALIRQFVREDGMSLLLISHDLGMMHDQVDKVMVMYAGSVIEEARTHALFEQRAHPYTRGLFAARPRLGMPRGTRLATIPGSVPELADLPPGCAFAARCTQAQADCKAHSPQWISLSELDATSGHRVRCPYWRQT